MKQGSSASSLLREHCSRNALSNITVGSCVCVPHSGAKCKLSFESENVSFQLVSFAQISLHSVLTSLSSRTNMASKFGPVYLGRRDFQKVILRPPSKPY